MRFVLRLAMFFGLSGFAGGLCAASAIINAVVSPSLVNVGDYAHMYFDARDSGAPVLGAGHVEVRGRRVCRAQSTPILGRYVCSFSIPHGGIFTQVIHFTPVSETPISLSQTQLVGDLTVVRAKPAIARAGRASLLFAKLDFLDPGSNVQPTGSIVIAAAGGSPSCTIKLPQLTHCFLQFPAAGTFEIIARYSGDAQFPPLISPVFLHSVAEDRIIRAIARDETVVLQPTPLLSERLDRPNSGDSFGLRASSDFPGIFDYSVGTRIPAFGDARAAIQPDTLLAGLTDSSGFTFNTLRGFSIARPRASRFVDGKFLLGTSIALNVLDTNQANDFYLTGAGSSIGLPAPQWLTSRADGSASSLGVDEVVPGLDGYFFVSAENGFVSGDADNFYDLFFVNPAAPTPALRIRRYPLNATNRRVFIAAIDSQRQQALISGNGLYLLDLRSDAFTVLVSAYESVFYAKFAPNGDVVYQTGFPGSLVRVTRAGAMQAWPIATTPESTTLSQVLESGEAQLFGANTQRKVNLSTGASSHLFNEYAGDEFLLRAGWLNFNASGDRLAVSGIGGSSIVSLNELGENRITLPADYFNVKLDPGFDRSRQNIAFESGNAALVPDDSNGVRDVFYKNLRTGLIRRISQTAQAGQLSVETRLAALGASFAIIDRQSNSGNPPLLGGFQPLLIRLSDNSPIFIAPPEAIAMGFTPSRDASSGIWVARDRSRAYFQRLVPLSAPVLITLPLVTDAFTFKSAAISTDGSHGVLTVSRGNSFAEQDWLVEFASQSARIIQERTAAAGQSTDVRYTLVRNGEIALRNETIFFDDFSFGFQSSNFLMDLRRNQQANFPAAADAAAHAPALGNLGPVSISDDGAVLAWAYQSASPNPTPNLGLVWQRSPYAGVQTYTRITRSLPSVPLVRQSYLVEAVISHKALSGAPSGVVKFDDGLGSQCEAAVQPQGRLALAQCSLRSFYARSAEENMPRLTASYLGDSQFAGSSTAIGFAVARNQPVLLRLRAISINATRFRVTPDFLPRADTPFLGMLRISVAQSQGVLSQGSSRVDTQACDLSAERLAQNAHCEFSVDNPEAATLVYGELIDASYAPAKLWLTVDLRNALFASGFE